MVAFAQRPGKATLYVTMTGRKGTRVDMLMNSWRLHITLSCQHEEARTHSQTNSFGVLSNLWR